MTKAQTSPVYKGLLAYIGVVEGESITYTAPCAMEERSLALEKQTSEETIPDCDDPSQPGSVESEVEAVIARLSGGGLMAEQSIDAWDDAFESVPPVPIRIDVVKASGAILRRECLMHITGLTYNGPGQKAKVRYSIEGASHGPVIRTKVPAPEE